MSEEIDLGARLFELRDERGWAQRVLEKESGVSHTTIAGIETGRIRSPRSATLRRLARAFDMSLEEFRGKALAPPSRLPDEEAEEARRDVFRFWRVFIRERVERWDGRIEEARTKRRAPYKGWTDDLKLAVRGLAGQIESEDVLDTLALEMNAIESGANVPQETLREAMELYQALVQLTQVFPRAMDANREVHREQQMVAEDGTIDMLGRLSAKREALGKAS